MPEIRCKVIENDVQCGTVLQVSEPVSENASFICKNHPDAVQRRAAGNAKARRPDVHLQDTQFDRDMTRSRRPIGTSHIHRQGQAHNCEKSPEGPRSSEGFGLDSVEGFRVIDGE